MIALFRTLIFYPLFIIGSVPIILTMALFARVSHEVLRRGAHIWASWFVLCARIFLGIRLEVRGRIPQSGVLVASKHQSWYEAILTLYLFDHPAVVMKEGLRHIPFWGFLAAGHGSIFVERDRGGAALKSMLRQAKARAADGRPVFIFPEGTRVAVGTAPPLKAGLFALYGGLRLPVVPMAVNAGYCWPKRFAKHSGVVTVSFLPDIPAGLGREELEAAVLEAINRDPLTAEVRT